MDTTLRAILIDGISTDISKEEAAYRLNEAENLVKTYGGVVLVKKIQKRLTPNYATYIGSGKIEEIIEESKKLKANIVIINNELKPRQTYNLSEQLRPEKLEVWDRIDLILKIFQKHAETREAKLEIQLASIRHMGPRIFGMGMEMSRQGGGIGTKGVGETNIEFMKRHLKKMEDQIRKELENCKRVRKLHRDGRKRKNLMTIGIIGYTNAGKTSLLNALTRKGAYAANKLFATLDTRVGKMYIIPKRSEGTRQPQAAIAINHREAIPYAHPHEALISDTIGFIQDLPTTLIKSFQSTLEETIEADLLLHVIDVNDPKMEDKINTVNHILAQINVAHKPTVYVFNKIDSLENRNFKKLEEEYKKFTPCFVSAETREGVDALKEKIADTITAISI